MTQNEINLLLIEILQKIAEHIGEGKRSEPKHEIKGDEIADMIFELEMKII